MRFLTSLDFFDALRRSRIVFQFELFRFTAGTCTKLYSLDFTWGSAGLCTKLSFWVQFYSCTFQPIPNWKRNKVCCSWHPIYRNIANHEHSSWHAKSFFAWQFFTHAWAAKFIRNRERERPNRTGEKMQCDHLQSVWGCHPALWFVEVNLFCFSLFTLQRGMFCHPKHTDASQSQVAGSCKKVYRY